MTTTEPQWSMLQAMAWIMLRHDAAVEVVTAAALRDGGSRWSESPAHLQAVRLDGKVPAALHDLEAAYRDATGEIVAACEQGRVVATGRRNRIGARETIPREDWEDLAWLGWTDGYGIGADRPIGMGAPDEAEPLYFRLQGRECEWHFLRFPIQKVKAVWNTEEAPPAEDRPEPASTSKPPMSNADPPPPGRRKPGRKKKSYPAVRQYLEFRHQDGEGDLHRVTLKQLCSDVTKRLAADDNWPKGRTRQEEILKGELARLGVEPD